MDNTLDDIRLKEVGELNATDKKALNDNWDKLTAEEQKYFGDVKSSGEGEGGEGGFKMEFKTEEELNEFLDKRVEERLEVRRKAREEEKKKSQVSKDDRIFPEGFKAPDW